jgi:tRNA nucleotidyltransferase (CCA-adding enzyme)
MGSDAEARKLLAAAVPANVRAVCKTIVAAGHEAVTVGGAVRDALIGREPGDWDVATSARPDDVLALFRHTIPTGLQHGTVTVVTGKGAHTHVEVTTFRGEGAYSDARRPDHVVFGVPLVEDLARRDFVVNAIAYDPEGDRFVDPFGGQGDIAAKRLRAVGDPVARFTEDGLRVMRAVRFAAQLEFDLDPATEAGIAPALPSLAKVSRERVSDELRKLLAARQPSRGLVIAARAKVLATVLPDLDARLAASAGWAERVDRAPLRARLAALLVPLAIELDATAFDRDAQCRHVDRANQQRVLGILRALKFSNHEAELAAQLVAVWHAINAKSWTGPEVRRLLAELDAARREPALELWAADATPNAALVDTARRVLAARDPLAVGDLAVTGKDVMTGLDVPPGPVVGRILTLLLEHVLDDPTQNTREALLAHAQKLELELGR